MVGYLSHKEYSVLGSKTVVVVVVVVVVFLGVVRQMQSICCII